MEEDSNVEAVAVGAQRRKRKQPTRNPHVPDAPSTSETVPAVLDCESKLKDGRRKVPWSDAELSAFHEALKIYGKDFDQIVKHMNSKNKTLKRDKDQIRYYYYNTLKLLNALNTFSAEEAALPGCAKELFLLINFGEWRRRTGRDRLGHNDRIKFNELVRNGSVSTRIRTNHSSMAKQSVIRTPHCASLRAFCHNSSEPSSTNGSVPPSACSSSSTSVGVPCASANQLTFTFSPLTNAAKAYVLHSEQNPFVRLSLRHNQPLGQVIALLQRKWIAPIYRQKALAVQEDMRMYQPLVTARLAPDIIVSDLHFQSQDVKPAVVIYSFAQYISLHGQSPSKDVQEKPTTAAVDTSKIETDCLTTTCFTDSDACVTAVPKEGEHSSTISAGIGAGEQSNVRVQASQVLQDGLNQHCLLTAAQLAHMCQCPPVLQLTYEVQAALCCATPPVSHVHEHYVVAMESWRLFMNLLVRGFNDELMRVQMAGETQSAKSNGRAPTPAAGARCHTPAGAATPFNRWLHYELSVAETNGPSTAASVVSSENAQFREQMEGMFGAATARSRRVVTHRITPVPIRPRPAPIPAAPVSDQAPKHQVHIVGTESTSLGQALGNDFFAGAPVMESLSGVESVKGSLTAEDFPSYLRAPMQQLTDEGSRDFLASQLDDRFVQEFAAGADSNSSLCTPKRHRL